ncbi:hypothetical protein ACE6H2_009657 [Prunus campanulata]
MWKKTKKPGKGKEKVVKAEEKRARTETRSSHLRMTSMPFCGIEEPEYLIGSTLSSDITLFEKISSSTYCVRINSFEKKVEESQSDTKDSGVVDDDLGDSVTCSGDDDSGCNSGNSQIKKLTYMNHGKSKDNMVTVYTEIDESHTREVWLLGLMEGEYSDLSIEEKLSSIVAPIDLLHVGSSFRMEVESNNENQTLPSEEKCELALEGAGSQEHSDKIAMLVDDEELELRELQGRRNALGVL